MKKSFSDWMRDVDAACWKLAGCSAHDLADYCYADAYADGSQPLSTARRAIRADQGDD